VLDDLQWCDAATLDLLDLLLGTGPSARLLLLLTARAADLGGSREHAEWVRRWRAAGVLREVRVEPLTAADTAELLRQLTGRAVPGDVADAVVSTTGGFPLYVVEAARQGTGPAVADPSPDLGAVLQERLGQLTDPTSAVAGLAAAVGRPFDLELLCEAADLEADAVVQAVDELWRLRIVRETARGYDFTHDLLRTAAYERVNPPRRWLLHRRLAQALEVVRAGRTDEVAAQLADQYSRAGNAARALESYHRAAEVAARVFAHAEAVRLHRAALSQLATLPEGPDRDLLEVRTLASMSGSLNALKGYADPELSDALERTVALAERLGLRETLVDALVGLWGSRFVRADTDASQEIALRAVAIADAAPDAPALSGPAHFALAGASFGLGDLAAAQTHMDLAIARSSDTQTLSIGSHAAIHARAWSAHIAWLLGDTGRAAACADDAVDRARALAHPYSLAIAVAYAALTWQLTGERERLVRATDELERLSARHGFAYYPAWSLVLGGWAADDAAGTTRIERGIADLRATGSFARMPYWLGLLAERCDPDRARSVLDAAVVTARARADRWWLPELLRRRALGPWSGSAASGLREALAVAEGQGSATLAERCRRDLAVARTPDERTRS
jgi:tetratricopeptide (TPR) repeat protein